MEQELVRLLAERRAPPVAVDVPRLRRERHDRLQAAMDRQDVDVALLLHRPNVAYASGHPVSGADVTHAVYDRPLAVVVAGADEPTVHLDLWPELAEGATRLARLVADLGPGRIAVDELTGAMLRAGATGDATVVEAAAVVGPAKLTKTTDELACIAEAQRRNEAAMEATQALVEPGMTRSRVAGELLAQLALAGSTTNLIDPIFQPMPRSVRDGPRTTTGDVAFPVGGGDAELARGDLVWVDSGIDHLGYASDFGRTWVIGRDPTPAEHRLFRRWCKVMVAVLDRLGPGATAGDLCWAATEANDGVRPWLPHFYLAHGLGVESAEMPLVGTDLGPDFDEALVLVPGMVLVLEPVIWEDGVGGYRAEEIVAVTDDGWCHLGGGHPYPPFAP